MNRHRTTRRKVSENRAFTLLEVVIAMLLLGIGLLALMALQIRSIRSNTFSNCMTVASCMARNQIESLRGQAWDDIPEGTSTDTVGDVDPITGATRMVFTRQWYVKTDTSGRMRDVTVTVSWNQDGRPHQMTLNTRIAKRKWHA